ncbi:MAG: hypothetical protein Q8R20_00470, partial [Nanoarchaeota archaeon]|nr:hypothetical protein [Nanoarchaeota archaeon]
TYLEEVAKNCYGESRFETEKPRPEEKKKEGLDVLTKPFEPILKPFVGNLISKEQGLRPDFPYTFSDGFIAKTQGEAEARCKEYPAGSGRGIAAECEVKIGVVYESVPARQYVNWVRYIWTFSDKSTETSYIFDRTDREYVDYIQSVGKSCLNIQRYKFQWRENAGDSSPENWKNFGIPDCTGERVATDACYAKYGPGWITKDTTKNCYDAYGPNFKTPEGKIYACSAIPTGISAPGCMKKTIEDAPRPIYGESPSDCSAVQYWDNTAKTCALFSCSSGYAWDTAIRGCKNEKDGSPACPTSTYWNTATKKCESLKCAPPQYWDEREEKCKEPAVNPVPAPGTTPVGGKWANYTWTFASGGTGFSSILSRTDKEYLDYIAGVEAQCKNIAKDKFCWRPGAGNDSDWKNFGIPDCSGTCASGGTGGGTYSGTGGGCGAYVTQSGCVGASGCSWNSTSSYCYSSGSGTGNYSSCSASLTALLGTGCHYMYNDSSGKSVYCDNSMTKSAKEGDAATTSGCTTLSYTTYPGDQNSCPGFAYSTWDSSGKRYCKLNAKESCQYNYPDYLTESNYSSTTCPATGGTGGGGGTYSSCSSAMKTLLGPDCHYMYQNSSGQATYCDGPMTKSAKEVDTTTTAGCALGTTGGGGTGGGGSTGCGTYTTQSSCASVSGCAWAATYCYSSGAGGGSTACNNNGTCEYGESSGSCPSDCGTSGGGGSSSCTPALTALLGTGCHFMSTNTYCDGPMTKSAKEGDTTTTAGCSSGTSGGGGGSGCGAYITQSSCTGTSGCAWAATYCYSSGGGGGGSSSCSASLTALLGTGCHYMYQNSSGQTIYCDGPMTKFAKEGDAATTAGCSSSGGAYMPTGQGGFASAVYALKETAKKIFWVLSY